MSKTARVRARPRKFFLALDSVSFRFDSIYRPHVTHEIDTWTRAALLLLAVLAVGAVFAVAALDDLTRVERFLSLSLLSLIAAIAGSIGLDLIQGYTKRQPLRMRWGKPRADLGRAVNNPERDLPSDWQIEAALRLAPLAAALAGTAALALIFGALSYAISGSPSPNGQSLILYIAFATATWQTGRFALRFATRNHALRVTADAAVLGVALGYIPPLTIARHTVDAIETSAQDQSLAFVTSERRFTVSTAMLDAALVGSQLAGLWPDTPWHELSPDAIRTRFAGLE